MNIPLVNNNSVDAINTSLIAIKKTVNSNNQIQDVDVNVGINIATNCTYCAASSTTIKGAQLYNGCSIKVLFTSAITGSDTTTPMSINYNGVSIPVKTGKNGVLSNFVANNIDGSYIYCQAYTTLELLFDGTQFIIMGNPVVISSTDYTIYTDGKTIYDFEKPKTYIYHLLKNGSYSLSFNLKDIFGVNFYNDCYGVKVSICSNIYSTTDPGIYYEAMCIYRYPQYGGFVVKEIVPRSSVTISANNDIITIADGIGNTYLNIRLDLI